MNMNIRYMHLHIEHQSKNFPEDSTDPHQAWHFSQAEMRALKVMRSACCEELVFDLVIGCR